MANIIDGKLVSKKVREEVANEVVSLKEKGVVPGLAVIIVGDDPASRVYVNNKKKACADVGFYSEEYASEFTVWDNGFDSGKPNTQLRIPFQIYNNNPENEQALNQLINQRLRSYSWLSLSPDYIVKTTPTTSPKVKDLELDEGLDPETKSRCEDGFEGYQKDVLSAFSEYVSKANDNLNEYPKYITREYNNAQLQS